MTYTCRRDLEFRRTLPQFVKHGQTLPSSVCPQLRSHMHTSEGRLCHAWEHQHPVLLDTPKSFCFSSAGTILLILHESHSTMRYVCRRRETGSPCLGHRKPHSSRKGSGEDWLHRGSLQWLEPLGMTSHPSHLLQQSTGTCVTHWAQQARGSN